MPPAEKTHPYLFSRLAAAIARLPLLGRLRLALLLIALPSISLITLLLHSASPPSFNARALSPQSSTRPVSRLPSNSPTPSHAARWLRFHQTLAASAHAYNPPPSSTPLILLGDSITESWLGTSMGRFSSRAAGVPRVLDRVFKPASYAPLVLGVSGDQTQHLLWRLRNGEVAPGYAARDDAIAVVMIGTNNLGRGHTAAVAAEGVLAVAREVLSRTKGRVVLLAVLPRGDTPAPLCPPRCDGDGKQFATYLPMIDDVNRVVEEASVGLKASTDGRLRFMRCGDHFLGRRAGEVVRLDRMPDRLHPNAAGHELMARCMLDCIEGKCTV